MNSSTFSDKVRVRACAVIESSSNLLLIRQKVPTREEPVWMPPGGGVQFGETIETALAREVHEETGLKIKPVRLLWIHEFLELPYHAIEFYFECSISGGMLRLGNDPELSKEEQMLLEVKFVSPEEAETYPITPEFLIDYFKKGSKLPESLTRIVSY